MTTSRDLLTLHPEVYFRAKAFIEAANSAGIELLVTCTYRDYDAQNELYAQGRTKPGKIVTNAKGGESYHNWRCALDVVPLIYGKPYWENESEFGRKLWNAVGHLGEQNGLDWAGRWVGQMKEMAHFQYTGGLSLHELQTGKIPN